MNDRQLITIYAICGLVLLEGIALYKGVDGALFGLVVATISGLAGYGIAKKSGD